MPQNESNMENIRYFAVNSIENELVLFTSNALLSLQAYDKAQSGQVQEDAIKNIKKVPWKFSDLRKELEKVYGKTCLLSKPDGYIFDQDHLAHLANQTISFDWLFYAEILLMEKIENEL
jgi:hexosaminidase